jgi:hypothetical protein
MKGIKGMKFLLLFLGFLFIGIWLVSFIAFHVASGLIHILLVIGIIAIVMHFLTGRSEA